ncbi:hypothetical protein [Novosphingobium sp.]|uniref:hypothetical protein n=1 Tax=Novosphingobium sp. TaxID=1874826 RepID=UPI002637BB84|nr:hypothetical protein [Novosphingobium sp.]
MTTPDDAAPQPRPTRPEAAREGPHRHAAGSRPAAGSNGAAHAAAQAAAAADPAPHPQHGPVHDPDTLAVNDTVAATVRSAYDVLGETIAQGRRAAEQFRVGAYNVRDVPDDLRAMAGNLIGLARQMTSATFDICEALVRQADGLASPPPPGSTVVGPFPAPKAHGSAPTPAPHPAPQPAPAPDKLALSVVFHGSETARARTTAFALPARPVAPADLACDALVLRGSSAPPIIDITFALDPDAPGLLATISVPAGQPAGLYSGAVYCRRQALLVGLMEIEIG